MRFWCGRELLEGSVIEPNGLQLPDLSCACATSFRADWWGDATRRGGGPSDQGGSTATWNLGPCHHHQEIWLITEFKPYPMFIQINYILCGDLVME